MVLVLQKEAAGDEMKAERRQKLSKKYTATAPGIILICTGCNLPVREYTELYELPQGGRIRFCPGCLEELFQFSAGNPGPIQRWKHVMDAAALLVANEYTELYDTYWNRLKAAVEQT